MAGSYWAIGSSAVHSVTNLPDLLECEFSEKSRFVVNAVISSYMNIDVVLEGSTITVAENSAATTCSRVSLDED